MAVKVSAQSSSSHGMPYPKEAIERALVDFIVAAGITDGDFTVKLGAKCKGTSHTKGVSYKGRSGPTGLCLRVHPPRASNDECYEAVLIVPADRVVEFECLFTRVKESGDTCAMTMGEIDERIKVITRERSAIQEDITATNKDMERIAREINVLLQRKENHAAKRAGLVEKKVQLEDEERALAEMREEVNRCWLAAEKRRLAEDHFAAAVAEMKSAGAEADEISAFAAKLAGAA